MFENSALIKCDINLILFWKAKDVITNSVVVGIFAMTHTKLYVLVATLLTEDNANLLKQIDSGYKCTIIWYKP